jgi:hypothetical protein
MAIRTEEGPSLNNDDDATPQRTAMPRHGQRSARNNPALRDGDGSHGSPSDEVGLEEELSSDTDVGDTSDSDEPLAGHSGGAVGGTPAGKRARGGHLSGE